MTATATTTTTTTTTAADAVAVAAATVATATAILLLLLLLLLLLRLLYGPATGIRRSNLPSIGHIVSRGGPGTRISYMRWRVFYRLCFTMQMAVFLPLVRFCVSKQLPCLLFGPVTGCYLHLSAR